MRTRELLRYLIPLAALQAVFIAFIPPLFEPDSASYVTAARQLLDSSSAFMPARPPGYPSFLAAIYSLTGGSDLAVIIVQHLLGLLVWYMTALMLPPGRPRTIFTVFFACDLLYSSYQHAILADFLFSFLLCLSAAVLKRYFDSRKPALLLLFTVVIAAGIYTKPALKPFPLFMALFFLMDPAPWGARLRRAALVLAVPLLLTGLWSLRNYYKAGYFAMVPLESYHYIGRIINHVELPEGSVTRDYLLRERGPDPVPRGRRSQVVYDAMDRIREAGIPGETMDREFRQALPLSILRHPFVYLKESLTELSLFFASAHNLYAKHLLSGKMPGSAGEALRRGDIGPLLLKAAVSLHPFYWMIFLFTVLSAFRAARPPASGADMTVLYMYAVIAYIALVSSFANEGLARFRGAVHPFMLFFAAGYLDLLLRKRNAAGGGA